MSKLRKLNEQEMKESLKRFNVLKEYSFVNKDTDLLLDEDDDQLDQSQQDNAQVQGQGIQSNQEDPTMDQSSDQNNPNQTEPQIDSTPETQPQELPQELPQENIPNEEPESDNNEVEIDVTDLTDKQDDIESKISLMFHQEQNMLKVLDNLANKIQGIVSKNDSEMAKIKDEIIKRNPTPVEVLQKRITVSDPFTQTPSDYWNKKEQEGNYKLSDDEDLELKASDIQGSPSDIYKSFGVDDDDWNQSLASMFR